MVNNNNILNSVNILNEVDTKPLNQSEMDAMDEILIEHAEISNFVFKHFTGITQF